MDRVLNSKDEKKTIYEIYRACRLCGAGAGYKMPIIQSVVNLESYGLELRQKIKECIQIEVNHTDRMPPLICELCVDKVNDFYEFATLCKQTNERTRQRLGLPLQAPSRDSADCENCRLGVTESSNTDSEAEHAPGQRSKKARVMKEPVDHVKIKKEAKKEVSKLIASKKIDTMLQDMAEKAKKEVGMVRKEGGMVTEKAKRGSKQAFEEIPLTTVHREKMKVMTSKYKKVEKERENGRAALSSRRRTPDGRWERRRSRSRSPGRAHKRTTRQHTGSISSDIQVIDDTPLPEPRSRLKRPREKELKTDTPPLSKKLKLPEPKPKDTSQPGPKSKIPTKEPEPQKPATKDPDPPITTAKLKPASKKEIKPSPPASKPSKTKSKPEPIKTRSEPVKTKPEEPVKPKPAPKPLETKYICQICNHQLKTSQGLSQHNIVKHAPTFTAAKFACNACELWFPTVEECAAHHRAHREGLPYKCHRCYGYFRLQHEYESHFAENLCLSVYEVPDVQCWRCYQRFATGALLSAHCCPGEDARPGGKCSKCNRSYALLKNLLKHEATCAYKKKGEVTIAPAVQARLLNMQVKIARCDALLSSPRVHVARISHKYGLDSKARYPYLPARIKKEPRTEAMLKAKHMVTIDDSVKAEYWDSDSNDSQKVDTLTAMTLKTINKVDKGDDNDDLAKKIFSIIDNLVADDGQTSSVSDNLDKDSDQKQSDGESNGGKKDVVSEDNNNSQGGSDSILDKNDGKSEDSSRVNDDSDKMEAVKDVPERKSVVSDDERVNFAVADVKSDEANVDSERIDVGDKMDVDAEKLYPKKSEASSVPIADSEKMDVECEKSDVSTQNINCVKSEDKLTTELDRRLSGLEDKTAHENDQLNEETGVNEKVDKDKALHETIKTFHDNLETSEDTDMTSKSDGIDEQIRTERSQGTEEKANDEDNSNETQHLSAVNDNCSKHDNIDRSNQAKQDCSLDFNKDKLESDSKAPDNINANVHKTEKIDVNQEESYPPLINNEVFSKIDEITNKILKETETSNENSTDEHSAIENTQRSDNHSDSISLNSLKSINNIESQDKFNVDDLSDDDKKLMAELDAQIGEINERHQKHDDVTPNDQNKENDQMASDNDDSGNNSNDNAGVNDNNVVNDIAGKNGNYDNQGFTDKNINPAVNCNNQNGPSNNQINGSNDQKSESDQKSKDYLIDNLLRKQEDLKSLELDSISDDDFNFDA